MGEVADRSQDDGVINIVTPDNKLFTRIIPDARINAAWFGVTPGSTAAANTTAFRKARDYALRAGLPLYYNGNVSLSDSVEFQSTLSQMADVEISGVTTFVNKTDGFVITGTNPVRFWHRGKIDGGNKGGTDSASWNAYTGHALWIKSTFNAEVHVNEIVNARDGIYMTGGNGTGSQLNHIYFNHIYGNRAQLHLTTLGGNNNYNNQSDWHGGQLGVGIHGDGRHGWFGILVDRDPASNAKITAISGHTFYNVDFEGLKIGWMASYCSAMHQIGGSYEPAAMTYHLVFDTAIVAGSAAAFTNISQLQKFNEDFIPAYRAGFNTHISGTVLNSTPGVISGFEMYLLNDTHRWLVITPSYSGYTDWVTNLANDKISLTGQNKATEAGIMRFGGVIHKVAYKPQLLVIKNGTSSNADNTISAPANLGYVTFDSNEPKVVKINPGDLSGNAAETFQVEYNSTQSLTFVNGATGAVVIKPTSFSSPGTYQCTFRMGSYRVIKLGQ